MIKSKDVNKRYSDYQNKKITIEIFPAIIRKDNGESEFEYNVQFDTYDLRFGDGVSTNIILNEYQVRNLHSQLGDILTYFYNLKQEAK